MGETLKYKDKRRYHWPIAAGILAVASFGAWVVYSRVLNPSAGAVEVSTIAVELGTIEISVNNSGVVEFGGQQTLKSPTDGTVDRVLVQVGDRVQSGSELITLRPDLNQQTNFATQPLEIREKQLSFANTRRKVAEAEEDLRLAQNKLTQLVQENITRENQLATSQLTRREKLLELETQRQKLGEAQQKLRRLQQELAQLVAAESPTTQTRLAELNLESQKQELNLLNQRQNVLEAQAKLAADLEELQEIKDLAERGFIPENDVRNQENTVRAARFALQQAEVAVTQTLLDVDGMQLRRETIEQELVEKVEAAQNEVETAEAAVREIESQIRRGLLDLERTELELDKFRREPNSELEEAQQAVRQAERQVSDMRSQFNQERLQLEKLEISIQNTQEQLGQNIVATPIDATILQVMVKNGDGIGRGNDLLTLGDPSQEFVNLQLSTLDASQVKVQQEARVTVIGPNAQIYEGVVHELSPLAITGESSSSRTTAQAFVPATIKLETPTESLIPGAQVSVEIIVQQLTDVVALPIEVIQRDGPQPYIWTVDAQSQVQKQTLELGLEGVTQVEITGGLEVGDPVVVPPSDVSLEVGMVVSTTEEPQREGNEEGGSGRRRRRRN